jgi:hypothetical protein
MKDKDGAEQLTCSMVGDGSAVKNATVAALNDFKNSYGEVALSNLAVHEGNGSTALACSNDTKGRTTVGEDLNSIYIFTCATADGTAEDGNLLSNQTVVE